MSFAAALNREPIKLIDIQGDSGTFDRNPIAKLNKGYRKGRSNYQQQTPIQQQVRYESKTEEELRFSSLSRNKENNYLSENRLVRDESGFIKKTTKAKTNNLMEFSSIRKRLEFDNPLSRTSSSKGKGPTFGDIIKRSREKSFREGSKTKNTQILTDPKPKSKEMGSFNKLKSKLIGERRLQETIRPKQIEIVRVSICFDDDLNQSLNMQPTL